MKLKGVLNNYNADVGLLIYAHQNDTLVTMLIDRMGKMIRNEKYIEETALVNEIEKTNMWFSNNTLSRAPEKRGVVSIPAIDNFEYRDAYEKIGSLLLPFEADEFMEY